jgi:hypothetical protein
LAIGSSLAGLQALGYLLVCWRHGESMLRISGADIRADVAWQVALVLTLPLWIALLRSALSGRLFGKPPYTTPALLRRWIQMQNNGQVPDTLSGARRIRGR